MGSDMQQRDPGRESNPGPLQSLRHMGRARYQLSYAAPQFHILNVCKTYIIVFFQSNLSLITEVLIGI